MFVAHRKVIITKKIVIFLGLVSASLAWARPGELSSAGPNSPIAIIGAGAAGLSAAYQLKQQGYKNIVIYEKQNRVGGKVQTVHFDKDFNLVSPKNLSSTPKTSKVELGAIVGFTTYKNVLALAREYGIGVKTFNSTMYFTTGNGDRKAYKGHTGSGFWKSGLGIYNLNEELIFNSGLSSPGYYGIENTKLYLPISNFSAAEFLDSIIDPFELALVACGYGYLEEVPAVYWLKLMDLAWWSGTRGVVENRIKRFTGVGHNIMSDIISFPGGFQELWQAMAMDFDVRLNSKVVQVERVYQNAPQIRIQIEGGQEQLFDAVIIATPLSAASKYLVKKTQLENEIFGKVKSYNYNVTVFSSKDLPRKETIYFKNNMKRDSLGRTLVYTNYDEDSSLFVAYQQGGWGKDEKTPEQLEEWLRIDVASMGGTVDKVVYRKAWNYFPHFLKKDLEKGIYNNLEGLQGKDGVYIVGGIMNFEATETNVRYSQALVKDFFKRYKWGPDVDPDQIPLSP